jgi:DNA-binding transcriptional LysR family regulator
MSPSDTTPQLLNRLRMRQVALLLAIDERGTLRAAAGHLGLSQPAATKMLHELELTLGQPLFDRVGRGLRANAAGDLALAYFRGVRGTMETLNRELQELRRGGTGRLRVGSIMAASPADLTEALIRIKAEYPLLPVKIDVGTSDRLMEGLDEGSLDLVIGRVPAQAGDDYAFRPLSEEALSVVVATGHPLAGRRGVDFAALQAYPWILQPHGSPMRDVVEQEFRSRHTPLPRGLIETASILTTTNLIARTDMVAVIPEAVASRYARHGLLAILPCRLRAELASYGTIVRRDRPAGRAAARFLEILHRADDPAAAGEDNP